MKVLHINSYYGGGMFYKNLYDKQIEAGLKIDVYVPTPSTESLMNLELGEYTIISKNHNKYDRLIFHVKHSKIYKDIIKRFNINAYDISHAHSLFSNGYIAYKLKKQYGLPYIVAVRNTDVNVFFKKMIHLRKLGIQILKEAGRIIFLSPAYRDNVISKYVPDKYKKEIEKKSEIIPNGIDEFWLKHKPSFSKKINKDKIKILHVGQINVNKNLITTVKAIKLLRKEGYNIQYTVVGKIKDKKVFNKIKYESFLKYIGWLPKEKLIDVYQENDILVMPSINETFGLVYAEAMSQGLPIIYTKNQGFDGQFKEGEVGFHVECFDAKEIANKVKIIIEKYDNLSKNCIVKANKFNWGVITKKYIQIYSQVY